MAAFLQFTMTSFPCSLVEVQIFAVSRQNEHFFLFFLNVKIQKFLSDLAILLE